MEIFDGVRFTILFFLFFLCAFTFPLLYILINVMEREQPLHLSFECSTLFFLLTQRAQAQKKILKRLMHKKLFYRVVMHKKKITRAALTHTKDFAQLKRKHSTMHFLIHHKTNTKLHEQETFLSFLSPNLIFLPFDN